MLHGSEMDNPIPTSIFKEQELDDSHHGTAYKVEFIVEPPEEIRENDLFQRPMIVRVRNLEDGMSWCPVEAQIHVKVFHATGSDRFELPKTRPLKFPLAVFTRRVGRGKAAAIEVSRSELDPRLYSVWSSLPSKTARDWAIPAQDEREQTNRQADSTTRVRTLRIEASNACGAMGTIRRCAVIISSEQNFPMNLVIIYYAPKKLLWAYRDCKKEWMTQRKKST
ncbi:mitochondrial cytochrome oxidase assembly factor [Histoplasma capsulatum]|uniref:Mitochondrial cytochrome oxidase assembly factor n=1 Tax=Ajellomyces capsulatus TaxID=5037 RepID=A0A8A1M6V0_AJECA|nr:mitochondrial cytochrome oxidase assembly factor [Histoplasma capsulatum]